MSTFLENTLKIVDEAAEIAKITDDILSRLKKGEKDLRAIMKYVRMAS